MLEFYRQAEAYTQEFDRRPGLPPFFIKLQLEKHIGERFNVLLSKTRYELRGDKIFGEGSNEPFTDVLIRGQDFRKLHGNPMDQERENAEVLGFQKIEKIMTDHRTSFGTMVLSFSLKGREGSSYQHNFYDIFTKNQDGSIEARRYSSALGAGEAARFYLETGYKGKEELADDSFFLLNPIIIKDKRFKTPDDLHRYLHRDHPFTTVEEFERIIRGAKASILKYAYSPTPFNFNEALNAADLSAGLLEADINDDLELGLIPVREVKTGCGLSGGAYSLSEFGTSSDKYGSLNFDCPHCKQTNRRKPDQLIANCKHCGKDVRC